MTDEELLLLNRKGFIPGPKEAEEAFFQRVEAVKKAFSHLDCPLPSSHWDWVRLHLNKIFDFAPECLPAFYSNRSLAPWQGAASWIEEGGAVSIQLREQFRKGSYLGIYQREEILAHEAVHAARAAFREGKYEEFFAYMTSETRWRRVLGPLVTRPWEVWPFLGFSLFGPFWEGAFLAAALWLGIGFWRLSVRHRKLGKAANRLWEKTRNKEIVRAVLFRLTDEEIENLAKGKEVGDHSLRWRAIRLAYFCVEQGKHSSFYKEIIPK